MGNIDEEAKKLILNHIKNIDDKTINIFEFAKKSSLTTIDIILKDYSSYRLKPYLSINQIKEVKEFWILVKSRIEQIKEI